MGIFYAPDAYADEFGIPPHKDMLRRVLFRSGEEVGVVLPDTGGPINPRCRRLFEYEDHGVVMNAKLAEVHAWTVWMR